MGTVVGGKIESGCVLKGQQLLIMPVRLRVEVLSIIEEEVEKENAYRSEEVRKRHTTITSERPELSRRGRDRTHGCCSEIN